MQIVRGNFTNQKGWHTGPWNSELPISVGYANAGIDEPHLHERITEIYLIAHGTSMEAQHFPIPEPNDPVEVLEFYMESRGLSRSDLIPYLGSKEQVSEVLNRKRGLSLAMIRKLHAGLGIPTDLLVGKRTRETNPTRPTGSRSQLQS
jgi:antitoxin component HigA of HigAB toxin-antitoxin module